MKRKELEFFQQQNSHWKKCESDVAAAVVEVVVVVVVVMGLKAHQLLQLFVPVYQLRNFMDHCVH
jgi:hypothetical protein